ncbi:MAG: hypothetical protein DMF35_04425 [Verrucomicrobia bacterium]|nr:MAG: hypothetical protein DMF35_04425 [Verrucomicrobiota bacterium]
MPEADPLPPPLAAVSRFASRTNPSDGGPVADKIDPLTPRATVRRAIDQIRTLQSGFLFQY